MKLYQKLLQNIRLKACEVIDYDLIPAYYRARDEFFEALGIPDIGVITDPAGPAEAEDGEIVLDSDPLAQALDAIHESISSSVWIKRDADPFHSSEYVVGGMCVQEAENSVRQFVVLLKDRHTDAQQPIPLYVLLNTFQPLEHLKPQDYHS